MTFDIRDAVLLALVALWFTAAVLFLIRSKVRAKRAGSGSGCTGCGACAGCASRSGGCSGACARRNGGAENPAGAVKEPTENADGQAAKDPGGILHRNRNI